MTEHITQWLGAYHDGELRGAQLRRIEGHLTECTACRAELEEIRNLSALLQNTPTEASYLPAERFAANLALTLPRRTELPQARSPLEIGWWLVPVGLLAAWVFIGITYSLSSAVSLAIDPGLLTGQIAWQQVSPLQMDWFSTATRLFGDQLGSQGREALAALSDANVFVAQLVRPLVLQAVVAVTYLGWLFAWWLRQNGGRTRRVEIRRRS